MLNTILLYKEGIEISVWAVGLIAILATALQLAETKKQRGLAESFDIYEKIDEQLAKWLSAQSSGKSIDTELGRILGIFEITSDAINKGYLSKIAQSILENQIVDSLSILSCDIGTTISYKRMCEDENVCSSMKIFLLRNYRKVLSTDNHHEIISMVFGDDRKHLFSTGLKARISRHRQIFQLRLS